MPRKPKRRNPSVKEGLAAAYIRENFSSIPDGPEIKNGHVLFIHINNTLITETIAAVKAKLHFPCKILHRHIIALLAKTIKKYRNLHRDSDKRNLAKVCDEVYTSYNLLNPTAHPSSPTTSCPVEMAGNESSVAVNEPFTPPREVGLHVSPTLSRSSRKVLTPNCTALKSRLQSVTNKSAEKQRKYQSCVRSLKDELNSSRARRIKYLNQDIARKKTIIAKQSALIKVLRAKLNKCDVQAMEKVRSDLNKLQRTHRRLKSYYRQERKMGASDQETQAASTCGPSENLFELIDQLKHKVSQLENDKLILEENLRDANDNRNAVFQKQGISFRMDMRMFVHDSILANVPTHNISHLIQKFAQRIGFDAERVSKRSTIDLMVREMGSITNFQVGEFLANNDNLALGFDATTQEGVHVNEIHLTSRSDCLVVSLDQLPGGTAEDYYLHIEESVHRVAEVYSKFYEEDFNTSRRNMIKHIKNTLTDRVVVNHAAITKLEESWGVLFNELNCHLHPLESVARKCNSALKSVETGKGDVFGNDCVAENLVLAINKFRYKDSKGDPKGFVVFLESNNLPKGIIPRYRGNRLHILFLTCGRLLCHHDVFLRFVSTGAVTCGGLRDAILADFNSSTGRVEMQVLGLVGKLISGPWMAKFYTSSTSQTVNHVQGIEEVKLVVQRIHSFVENPKELLGMKCNFFGDKLEIDDVVVKLQEEPCDTTLYSKIMTTVLSAIVNVLKRQYGRYFEFDITEELLRETASSRCHNMDAESVMGMFSASQDKVPNL